MQGRLLFRGRHLFQKDLKIIDLGQPNPEVLREAVADRGLSATRGAPEQQNLPAPYTSMAQVIHVLLL
jgi:hypothetical protein